MTQHKWEKYSLDRESKYFNPRFGGNLKEFIRRMVEDLDYEIGAFFCMGYGREHNIMAEKNIAKNDFDEIAYQALNYEHTNMDFEKVIAGVDVGQTVSIDKSGDAWCDVIPVNDWSFNSKYTDVVDGVIKSMRKEIMGEDA